jgi:CMP/dCMP kinase
LNWRRVMLNKNISIAIDGPSGAGKSTIAKNIAKKLSIEYIDTGSMYRALTLKTLNLGLNPCLRDDVLDAMKNTTIDFNDNHIYLDGQNVDMDIRENIINNNVSYIAKIKEVREAMVDIQRQLASKKSVIMDGRDIGTVVLPEADYKFFITASIDERSNRRYKELLLKGEKDISFEQIKTEMIKRDEIDSTREISPLIKSEDAYVLDNTNKTIDECVNEIISIVKGVM